MDAGKKRKRCLKLLSNDHKFDIVNMCNGFLCLSNKDIVVVSNPVTGEYLQIPTPIVFDQEKHLIRYGLGFSPRTNNYKVIRIFGLNNGNWSTKYGQSTGYETGSSSYVQIQTMGSRSWKNIGLVPYCTYLNFPTYLNNGTLNWLAANCFVLSFDCDNDRFGSFLVPPSPTGNSVRLGILRDHLCYCDTDRDILRIWEMNEYSVEESWTKVCNLLLMDNLNVSFCDFYQPIVRLENGTILLFHGKRSKKNFGITYYEPKRQKYLRILGINAEEFEAVAYTPSFVLLKDVLVGNDVEVLNVESRCGMLKIQHESRNPYLVQGKHPA